MVQIRNHGYTLQQCERLSRGIRWMWPGWLYNVSGTDAVELKMKNGKRYRIGTDVPGELAEAIRQAIKGNGLKPA